MPLEKLLKGFRTFHTSYFEDNDHYTDLVTNGQSPEALVIACADSRNDPALLTQSEPGDIFVARNVAAIVPPYQPDENYHGTSATIEFAVRGLQVKDIVVLGHALCGGVQALAEYTEDPGKIETDKFEFMSPWLSIGSTASETVNRILPDLPKPLKLKALEQALILTSLNNLMTFPWIRRRVENGELALHGWYFDMVAGELLGYDFNSGTFKNIGDKTKEFADGTRNCKTDCCSSWPLDDLVRHHLKTA